MLQLLLGVIARREATWQSWLAKLSKISLLILTVFCLSISNAFAVVHVPAKISIIIDDLGNDEWLDMRVVHLPGAVACSILPGTYYSVAIANACHDASKEVMLHAPMQPISPHRLGPGGLYFDMQQKEFLSVLQSDLNRVPYISGVNNHMGSLLTQSPVQMGWLMQTLKTRDLYFVDSVTSPRSVAEAVARANDVPTRARDVFLDDIATPLAIQRQFNELLMVARRQGSAIAIGHPYPVTLTVLERLLPHLAAEGYELVPVSSLLTLPQQESPSQKQFYLTLITATVDKVLGNQFPFASNEGAAEEPTPLLNTTTVVSAIKPKKLILLGRACVKYSQFCQWVRLHS